MRAIAGAAALLVAVAALAVPASAVGLGPLRKEGVTDGPAKAFYLTLINPYAGRESFRIYAIGVDDENPAGRVRLPAAQLQALQQLADSGAPPARSPIGLADTWREGLSLLRGHFDAATRERRMQVLLDALRTLQHDTSFDPAVEQPEWLRHAQALAEGGFRAVVFGHTHLAKQVPLAGGAVYLNTGTWADLMRLPAGLTTSLS